MPNASFANFITSCGCRHCDRGKRPSPRAAAPRVFLAFVLLAAAGCGANKFQQEVEREKSAVALARETERGDYDLLTTAELNELVEDDVDMVLIDAMPYDESYKKQHIPGASQFLFPKEEMDAWDEAAVGDHTTDDYRELLGDDPQKLIVVYCGFVSCLRSHNAASWARRLGYQNVKRYPGGIFAWKGAGLATEAAP